MDTETKYLDLRTVNAVRYIMPLREGGSLPALADGDDGFKYVVKFRGGGHSSKPLVAELIGGMIAKVLGFRTPELVFVNVGEAFGRTEGDEEIQDLLQASQGLNIGLHFLSGALSFDPVVTTIDDLTASKLVWMDALLMNIDRTVRNTNLLMWHNELWLIDHGSILYFHYTWDEWEKYVLSPFSQIKNHVLLPFASRIDEADAALRPLLTDEVIEHIVHLVPDYWLNWEEEGGSPEQIREVYIRFLKERIRNSQLFVNQIGNARQQL